MSDAPSQEPWLTIVGLGEDGPDGLPPASRSALEAAEVVMGATRHLSLLPDLGAETRTIEWPVPFSEGVPQLLALRGRKVVMLASGDPFWFGAGASLARHLEAGEWRALPAPSTFALAAARLGWSLERTLCLGLHAAPLSRLRPHLAPGVRAIVLLRDGPAVNGLAAYLRDTGFAASAMTVLEALGGPRERVTQGVAGDGFEQNFAHPLAVALEIAGRGPTLPCASGLDDGVFDSDGQMTKRPVRALALSALAPKPFERLWDIGGGSGSIAIEWLLSHPATEAISIEPRPDRAARIGANALRLGADRLEVVTGAAPAALDGLATPDAVFIGGGLSRALLEDLQARLAPGTRLVAHAVTLEAEALLADFSARIGGTLMRVELSEAGALGTRRAWRPSYPIVQWRVVL